MTVIACDKERGSMEIPPEIYYIIVGLPEEIP